jgi:hypothetical protein
LEAVAVFLGTFAVVVFAFVVFFALGAAALVDFAAGFAAGLVAGFLVTLVVPALVALDLMAVLALGVGLF